MNARPAVSPAADHVYDRLQAFQEGDTDAGWPLLLWCEALVRTFQRASDSLRHDDTGSGRRRCLDPDRCPAFRLGALAERAGVELPTGLSELEQRRRIREAAQLGRGRPQPLVDAIKVELTGGQRVRLLERHDPAQPGVDAAGHITFITRTSETPSPEMVQAAALTQKAAGLIPHHVIADGVTWGELDGITWGDLDEVTWNDLENGYTA